MPRRVIVELDALGDVRGFVVDDGDPVVVTRADGTTLACQSGVSVGDLPARAAPLFGESVGGDTVSVVVDLSAFDLWSIRASVPLQRVTGKLYWWPEGEPLRDEHELYRGVARNPEWERLADGDGWTGTVSFDLVPMRRTDSVQFPPTTIGDEGRFPDSPGAGRGYAVPVLYGTCLGVEVINVSADATDPKVMVIAGHRIVSTTVDLYREGAVISAGAAVAYAIDGLGNEYAYTTLAKFTYDLDPSTPVYVDSVDGWDDPDVGAMEQLGDVLIHLFRQYAGGTWFELDRPRVEAARSALNRVRVGVAVTQAEAGGTVLGFIEGRLASEMPFTAGFAGGRYGWDATLFPEEIHEVAELTFRHSAHTRRGPVETAADDVLTTFEMGYGLDGFSAGQSEALRFDPENNGNCRRALSRWGEAPVSRVSAPSCPTEGDAYVLLTDQSRKRTVVRDRVFYEGVDAALYDLPLLGVVIVTDSDMGWTDRPFLLESKQPRIDGRCDVGLVSVDGA